MNKNTQKMNTKNILVSFLVIASVLFLTTAISAASAGIGTSNETVKVNDITVNNAGITADTASVNAGNAIAVEVSFKATKGADWGTDNSASNVKIKATVEGNSNDVTVVTPLFDIIDGQTYSQVLILKVPSDFQASDLSQSLPLNVEILNSDGKVDTTLSADLTVQRPSYDVAIKSVNVDNTISAGQSVPVDFVVKNIGYNNADDVYVTVSIPELNIQKQVYLGSLVTQSYKDSNPSDNSNDNLVSVSGTVNLAIPYDAKIGVDTLTVTASNDQATNTVTQPITVQNSVSNIAMSSGNNLVVLNPTNLLTVYTVKYNSNEQTVVVPAQSSQTVPISVPTSGDYKFDVSVYNGDTLLSTVNYSGSNQSTVELTNPVFILTVILAIVFLVLLVVLVVLITKKPQKTEEFGESYY